MLEQFKKADQAFVIKVKDWINQGLYKNKIKVTNFLSPHEQQILTTLVNQQPELHLLFEGGFKNAERCRGIIIPGYFSLEDLGSQVIGLEIKYNKRFFTPEHRQILGSLMALKIDRSVIGDIVFLENDKIYLAICQEFLPFIFENFSKVGQHSISLIEAELEQIEKIQNFEELEVIVSSMRLDVMVAAVINAPRSRVHDQIQQGFVQLNHSVEKNHSQACQVGDLISIKGYGRYQLLSRKRITRNKKIVIQVGKAKK